jgi:hypothetical protein
VKSGRKEREKMGMKKEIGIYGIGKRRKMRRGRRG